MKLKHRNLRRAALKSNAAAFPFCFVLGHSLRSFPAICNHRNEAFMCSEVSLTSRGF